MLKEVFHWDIDDKLWERAANPIRTKIVMGLLTRIGLQFSLAMLLARHAQRIARIALDEAS